MSSIFLRTQLNFGRDNIRKLENSRVAVFGIGGVGSYVVEALVRNAIGAIDITDNDVICETNINRQLYALHSTVGKFKVDVAEERIHDINPECKVTKHRCFFLPETSAGFDFSEYDYVVDCIDTVKGKIQIIGQAKLAGIPVISCMGAGNKLNPAMFEVADISQTSVCPLARIMRQELKKRGITGVKVVYSREKPVPPVQDSETISEQENSGSINRAKKQTPGSNSFTPAAAGLLIASEVIKDITEFRGE